MSQTDILDLVKEAVNWPDDGALVRRQCQLLAAHVLASPTEALGEITPCPNCDGSGKNAQGDCCRITGHARECACVLCQWKNAYYRNENEANSLRAQLQAAGQDRDVYGLAIGVKDKQLLDLADYLEDLEGRLDEQLEDLRVRLDERGLEVERLRGALYDISAANQLAFASDAANHMLGIARRALATPAATSPAGHAYTSTACLHAIHDRCRRNCKYCDVACHCTCHNIAAVEPPAQEHPDTASLNWLNEQIVDVIYLDDGRVIDVKGNDIRVALFAARTTPEAQEPQDAAQDPCWTCECPCHQEGRNRRCGNCTDRNAREAQR